MFAGQDQSSGPQTIYIASNAYWEDVHVTLPALPASMCWQIAVDTWEAHQEIRPLNGDQITIRARSIVVLVGE